MKILLLGANGQLGTDIQRVAKDQPDIDLQTFTRKELDVENLDKIPEILSNQDFDVLINCTSYHKTDEVEDNASKAVTINAHAVEKMAESCSEKHAHFLHISTDYVFSGDKQTPYTEEDQAAPLNVYGATKYLGETLARRSCAETYIIRVASLFGIAGASGKGGNFVETIIRLANEKPELNVVDDVRMSPTSTYTIAKMIFSLLSSDSDPGVYNIVNSGNATWYEFAVAIVNGANLETKVNPVTSDKFPTRALRPSYSVLENKKLSEITGQDIPHWKKVLEKYLVEKGYR